ncbi:hypothetical protein CEXT_517511 [Caerostris extrusa]|uniref:Uncharacterized protein n=1 Tax=Caerostris extrusa TaxID=172846 RepID=A0AAV4U6N6_CAEEX|nr:hypothetical protein CEXT_517511 [Caerostris extrusa]
MESVHIFCDVNFAWLEEEDFENCQTTVMSRDVPKMADHAHKWEENVGMVSLLQSGWLVVIPLPHCSSASERGEEGHDYKPGVKRKKGVNIIKYQRKQFAGEIFWNSNSCALNRNLFQFLLISNQCHCNHLALSPRDLSVGSETKQDIHLVVLSKKRSLIRDPTSHSNHKPSQPQTSMSMPVIDTVIYITEKSLQCSLEEFLKVKRDHLFDDLERELTPYFLIAGSASTVIICSFDSHHHRQTLIYPSSASVIKNSRHSADDLGSEV